MLGAQAVVIRRPGRQYPYSIEFPDNVVQYFNQYRRVAAISELEGNFKALCNFEPYTFKVNLVVKPGASAWFVKPDGHSASGELLSPLAFNQMKHKKAAGQEPRRRLARTHQSRL